MKSLITAILVAMLAISTSAYSTEETKKETAIAPKQASAVKTKRVCVTSKDTKTGNDVKKCKVIKIHQKHKGTKVDRAKSVKK